MSLLERMRWWVPVSTPRPKKSCSLQIQEPEDPARDHPLSSGVYVVGRSPNFPVSLKDRMVSRIHCVLAVKRDRTVRICDFQSSFGTSLRGVSLQPWEWRDVAEGDEILVGEHTRLRLHRSS